MDTQLVQTDTGIRLAFPEPADGTSVAGVLRTTDMRMRRGSAAGEGSKPQAGVAMSIMTLCKTIIGAGLLALPHALAQTGLILGVVLLVLVGAVQAFVLHLLAVCVKVRDYMRPGPNHTTGHALAAELLESAQLRHTIFCLRARCLLLRRMHGMRCTIVLTRHLSTVCLLRQACHQCS